MTSAQKAWCDSWVAAHARTWQTFSRKQWKYKFHGKVLVRFIDEVKMREEECSLILEYLTSPDCVETLSLYDQSVSPEWTPVSAWLEIQTRQNGALHAVRLYHGLNTDPASEADGPYLIEDGCAHRVSMTYYWKQPTIIDVPPGSSGVSYRIVNLSRDDEDGSYTYALERRERVQQDVPLYLHETDDFRDISHEEHLGVKQGVQAGQDASCDEHGTKVTKTIRKNEDCTSDIINDVTTDKPVQEQTVRVDIGLHGSTRTVTDINQELPKPITDLGVGQMVQNEKTPSGLFNTIVRTIVADFFGWLRGTCRKTIFRHTHTETTAQGSDPGFTHAEDAGGGVIHERDVQKTEFGWDVTDTTHTDQPVPNATKRVEMMLGGIRRTTVNRNQGEEASTAGMDIGDSITNERTESGLIDQTIVESDPADVGKVDENCDKNAFVHTHVQSEVVAEDPGPVDAEDVESGTIHGKRVQRTELGGYRVTDETRTARERSATTHSHASGRESTVIHFRNVGGIDESGAGVNVTVDVSATPNEYDLKDGTRTETRYIPEQRVVMQGTRHEDRVAVVRENEAVEQEPSRPFTKGVLHELSSNPNGHGSATVHEVTRTAKPSLEELVFYSESRSDRRWIRYLNKIVVFRNQDELPEIDLSYESCSPSFHLNDFELYDGQYHYQKLIFDRAYGSGGGTMGAQYDHHTNGEDETSVCVVQEKEMVSDPVSGQSVERKFWVRKYKRVTYDERILVSTMENMRQEVWRHPGKKDLDHPLVSSVRNGYAVVYSDIHVGSDWIQERIPDFVGNAQNGG